ncbi:hypothetical protein [Leucobacter sp. gxy201]
MSDEYTEHWVARAKFAEEQFAGWPDREQKSRARSTGEESPT